MKFKTRRNSNNWLEIDKMYKTFYLFPCEFELSNTKYENGNFKRVITLEFEWLLFTFKVFIRFKNKNNKHE